MAMSLKLFYKDKVFRYSVCFDDVTFAFLKNKILTKFPRLNWNTTELYWTDSEGDNISIADDDAVEELKRNSDKVLKITIKTADALVDVKYEKAVKSEKIKKEARIDESNGSSTHSRSDAVASVLENSTAIDDPGMSDKSETRSSSNLQNKNEQLQTNVASSVSHMKPRKRSFLKCSVRLDRLETRSVDNSSSSNGKKSKIVEKSVVSENAGVGSENKFVSVDGESLSVAAKNASVSSKRNSARNKQLNDPKIEKVGNGTIGTGNVSGGEEKSETLKVDKITSHKQCGLCGVAVKNVATYYYIAILHPPPIENMLPGIYTFKSEISGHGTFYNDTDNSIIYNVVGDKVNSLTEASENGITKFCVGCVPENYAVPEKLSGEINRLPPVVKKSPQWGCPICAVKSLSANFLKAHLKIAHCFLCDSCKTCLVSEAYRMEHMESCVTKSLQAPGRCTACKSWFFSWKSFYAHVFLAHEITFDQDTGIVSFVNRSTNSAQNFDVEDEDDDVIVLSENFGKHSKMA